MRTVRFTIIFATLILSILLAAIVAPVLAQGPGPNTDPQPDQTLPTAVVLLASLLVGRVGVPLVNWLKAQLNWTGDADKSKNVWLTFGVSCVLAVVVLLLTNTFLPITTPALVTSALTTVFTTATLIYKSISQPAEPV